MMKYPLFFNGVWVRADHNLFILSTTDKNDRLVIKLFYSNPDKVLEGLKNSTVYNLAFSCYRWDAKEFMKMIKITAPETKYFDGWVNGNLLEGFKQMLLDTDYDKYINHYIFMGIKRLEQPPRVDTMTDKEYDIAQIARYEKYSKRFKK